MIYKCIRQSCGFLFSRAGTTDQCPDCGGTAIREATPEEQGEFERMYRVRQAIYPEKNN